MLKSNLAIDVIKLDDPTLVLIFLSRSPPTDDGDGRRARQSDLRKCHDDLPNVVVSNNLAIGRLVPNAVHRQAKPSHGQEAPERGYFQIVVGGRPRTAFSAKKLGTNASL
jgi:hypothetical protein